ncbi:hypothetical protein [Streptomyces sp. NPDC048639]|uniref:hypothetical protein n=1 Tax=Streptomyces sp. NPDC048639 TaxID=3365581 RepID=UPI0037165F43
MDTTGRVGAQGALSAPSTSDDVEAGRTPQEDLAGVRRSLDGYLLADFPWYGLDEAFSGPRWLMQVGTAADGTVEHGCTGHGEEPTLRADGEQDKQRFAVVVTVAGRPVRDSADGTGVMDATSVSSAAGLAGSGLIACTWPAQIERHLRDEWLVQQTAAAWELAEDIDGSEWTTLSLPVDGIPTRFHYRESEFGWVLAGSTDPAGSVGSGGVHIGAYGRGMSAYGLGFSVIKDVSEYDH